jgi:hypothetical protein
MGIADWLPQDPALGPPLPRFLSIYWPWLQREESSLSLSISPLDLVTPTPLTTYENIEEVDFPEGFDPDTFMPRKIRIKRKSKELK